MKKVKLSLLALVLSLGLAIPTIAEIKVPVDVETMTPTDAYKKGYEDGLKTANSSNTSNTTKAEAKKETGKVSKEFTAALKSAQQYSDMMHMSKAGIFDQLTSEYGGKFPEDAAQYAIDNITADFKKNALESAKQYQDMMNMSKDGIYDQLVSEYGGKFTEEEAQYAVDNLE